MKETTIKLNMDPMEIPRRALASARLELERAKRRRDAIVAKYGNDPDINSDEVLMANAEVSFLEAEVGEMVEQFR